MLYTTTQFFNMPGCWIFDIWRITVYVWKKRRFWGFGLSRRLGILLIGPFEVFIR